MLLLEANIPEILRSSPYLQSLLSNEPFPEEGLEIPDGSVKQDLTVKSKADLIELLSTLRFWLVPEVAEQASDLLRFAFSPASQTDFVEVGAEFRNDIPFVDVLIQIVSSEDWEKLEIAAKFNHVCVLQFLCEKVGLDPTSQAACMAAGEGHLDCLTYLHSRGVELNNSTIEAAARNGHFECVEYMVDNISSTPKQHRIVFASMKSTQHGQLACVKQMLAEWGEQSSIVAMRGAATHGHLDILKYVATLLHNESEVIAAMTACVRKGHLDCLEHLHNLGYDRQAGSKLMMNASHQGHLNCLKFLHQHSYPGSEDVCLAAAANGHLECLKYAHEQGMPWDEYICLAAAEGGHLECLQYMREHGCPWWDGPAVTDLPVNSRNNVDSAVRTRLAVDIEIGEEEEHRELIAASACRAPIIDCLLYVLEQGASLSLACASNAANCGSLPVMEFLHTRGFTWEAEDCVGAVKSRSLECLQFLHQIGTPWDKHTLETAVRLCGACWTEEQRVHSRQCYEYVVLHGCPGAELHKLRE